jgi:hypothetical protein
MIHKTPFWRNFRSFVPVLYDRMEVPVTKVVIVLVQHAYVPVLVNRASTTRAWI